MFSNFVLSSADNGIMAFYGWWQFSVCLFAFLALMAVWWHIGKKQNDFGQVWLALSVLCWSFSGALEIQFSRIVSDSNGLQEGWRSILSLFNSLFILLALPWFRYLPKFLAHIIKSKYWVYIVGLPFLFSLLPTISKMASGKSLLVISELDVYYAILTLGFLGYVLWESFARRRLKALSWLSVLCVLITLVAQFYKLTDSEVNLTLFSAIFKTSLIMLFFALALSWVKELSEKMIPIKEQLKVVFNKKERMVFLKGFPGNSERKVILTPALFDLFHKFAERRKNNTDDWLEIKPKNFEGSTRTYDIKDHNEIKRLLFAILDGLFGKENWSKEHHLIPLKNTLFEMSEKRERKIRLAIPAASIFL